MSYITIDKEKCKSCYLCIDVCPKKLIKKGTQAGKTGDMTVEFIDNNNECTGCASCAMMCPDIAITGVYR